MDWGDVPTTIAAAIALIAALVALWQASEARKARVATQEQADAAKETLKETRAQTEAAKNSATAAMLQVNAAEKAAHAAEDQVREARRAADAAEEQAAQAKAQVEVARQQLETERLHRESATATDHVQAVYTMLKSAREITSTVPGVINIIANSTQYTIGHSWLRNDPYLEAMDEWEEALVPLVANMPNDPELASTLTTYMTTVVELHTVLRRLVDKVEKKSLKEADADLERAGSLRDDLFQKYHRLNASAVAFIKKHADSREALPGAEELLP